MDEIKNRDVCICEENNDGSLADSEEPSHVYNRNTKLVKRDKMLVDRLEALKSTKALRVTFIKSARMRAHVQFISNNSAVFQQRKWPRRERQAARQEAWSLQT